MELAKLVLEYLKALAWPLIVLLIVFRFRASIVRILTAVGDRLASAETVKVGAFGGAVEFSGTAKELKVEQQQLLAMSSDDKAAKEKAGRISLAIPELNNPLADIVGVSLLKAPRDGLTMDDLLETVLRTFSPQMDRARQAAFVLLAMAREVEKVLAQLADLDFSEVHEGRHSLTIAGRAFFEKVAARQKHLLSHFAAQLSQ